MDFLCESSNSKRVVFDPVDSHVSTHFADTPQLRRLVVDILSKTELTKDLETFEIDMEKEIGLSDVVRVDESDEVVYAIRTKRRDQGYVPFTKSQKGQPCRLVSLYLAKSGNDYELCSAWIGELNSPPFPQMDNATVESIPYWNKRAFVWGSQKIIPGSEIPNCPWLEG